MKILVDGNDGDISLGDNYDPTKLIENIESILYSSGRAINTCQFNNEDVELDALQKKISESKPQESDTLSITTLPLKEHLSILLDATSKSLDEIEEQAVDIADTFLDSDNTESLQKMGEWSSQFADMINNILSFISIFKVDVSNIKMGDQDFSEALAEIQEFVEGINTAIEKDDRTRVADLLEFELTSKINNLKDIFPILKQRMVEVLDAS